MPQKNANASAVASAASERELVFQRLFDAPRELVFEAWTNPKHLPHWWGPNGFTTTIQEMNLRPGGDWRLTMRGPDGREYRSHIVFMEVSKPSRLVYRHESEPGTEPVVSFEVVVDFAQRGLQTEVTMRMTFDSAEKRNEVVEKYHADEGGRQTLAHLADYLPRITEGVLITEGEAVKGLVLERTFQAPRELVFRAWTDPAHLQRWWGPKDFTNPVCEFDARPGGAILIHMGAPNGDVYPMKGEVKEVNAPSRLVFTSIALGEGGRELFENLNEVDFTEQSGTTKVTLRTTVLRATDVAPQFLAGMQQGWGQSLDRLADLCQSEANRS
jgi:uncharacterized protein YndB with AHSA1/START domain